MPSDELKDGGHCGLHIGESHRHALGRIPEIGMGHALQVLFGRAHGMEQDPFVSDEAAKVLVGEEVDRVSQPGKSARDSKRRKDVAKRAERCKYDRAMPSYHCGPDSTVPCAIRTREMFRCV